MARKKARTRSSSSTPSRVAQRGGEVRREALGVARLGEPCGEARRRIELRQLGEHLLGAEEVRADEGREVLADPVLVARDDRRVRDRQSERMAEQRHHREPVGDRADHRGLGKCRHVAPRRMARHAAAWPRRRPARPAASRPSAIAFMRARPSDRAVMLGPRMTSHPETSARWKPLPACRQAACTAPLGSCVNDLRGPRRNHYCPVK